MLTTPQAVRDHLVGIGEEIPADHESLLTGLIADISARVEQDCNRVFGTATYTNELHTGRLDLKVLYPRQWPVTAVTSVLVDGTAITEDTDLTLIDTTRWIRYKSDAGVWVGLYRGDGWMSVPFGVVLTYTAGYVLPSAANPTLPADLERAVITLSAAEYLHRGKVGVLRESFEGMSLELDRWPSQVLRTLMKYRKVLI